MSTCESLLDLAKDQRLKGLVSGRVVTLLAVTHLNTDLVEVVYRDDLGEIGERSISTADLQGVTIVQDKDVAPPFDADPNLFTLVAEAWRIKYAALFDPMAAINSSTVQPLPHQIRAVYEELLPKIPLRFLLADDPGAGKTIMAGLYLKELILRADCERAIIVAPGGLVEQWREELSEKFALHFEVFTPQMISEAQGRNAFAAHSHLIVRMDQVSRNEALMEQLAQVNWDVAIVDEAHRMSATFSNWAGEVKETKRFKLGRLLSETAHNFLLMTATPHAGIEEDFQLFMSLLDRDRFEGKFRKDAHTTDTHGLMRRMVKEELLTFEGKPLFPERIATTITYDSSNHEQDLYEDVTSYVRTEMGRAHRIADGGDKKRGNTIGFALTVLQRRLASSPEAILRSLERRKQRLETQLHQLTTSTTANTHTPRPLITHQFNHALSYSSLEELYDIDEEITDEERASYEAEVEAIVDMATAAQTIPELKAEITTLEQLVEKAQSVRNSNIDKKWVELRQILDEQLLTKSDTGEIRKLIIFTEHRDTLNYLHQKISTHLGRDNAVITIHGGTTREERKEARELFTHNPNTVVLLATDAAGEGLNLQRAHLMVNYDLPWNPNRIEQRFGRIHRIGQQEVCHLWNLVANNTREGDVFTRLLAKIKEMSKAYNGNIFNVLGDKQAFNNESLRELLIKAIMYGDNPERKAELDEVIDKGVREGLDELVNERALHTELQSALDVDALRQRMEAARERRLQPGFIEDFFTKAIAHLGGQVRKREQGRYEIRRVPSAIIATARRINRLQVVTDRYERITFDHAYVQPDAALKAELIAPGHPLLTAVIETIIASNQTVLATGTTLVDRRVKQADEAQLVFIVEQAIQNQANPPATVSHHFDYVVKHPNGELTVLAVSPLLDFDPPEPHEHEAIQAMRDNAWIGQNHEQSVRNVAYTQGLVPRMQEVQHRIDEEVARAKSQIAARLDEEVRHWEYESLRLLGEEQAGRENRISSSAASKRAEKLEQRKESRLEELDDITKLAAKPSRIIGSALVIPSNALPDVAIELDANPAPFAIDTKTVERRAVDAVLLAEQACGRNPVEMAHNNPGFDIKSTDAQGKVFFIEVKGRIQGGNQFHITRQEVNLAKTQADRHRLALVEVSLDGPQHDQVRYVANAFAHLEPSNTTRSYEEDWKDYWSRGSDPR